MFRQNGRKESDAAVGSLVADNTAFALALYQKLRAESGNLFFSPYSISTALAMTYAGARGETAMQMAQALRFHLDPPQLHAAFANLEATINSISATGQVQLSVANALYPQQGYLFLPDYLALVAAYYGANITAVDYRDAAAACHLINTWVAEKTAQKIQNLIPPSIIDALTILVLVNAIYFKGNWASQFDPDLTADTPFWFEPEQSVSAPLMRQTATFAYGEGEGLQIVSLPYVGDDLSMLLLLPRERDGLAALEENLTAANLARWGGSLRPSEVDLFLPRFETTFSVCLNDALQALGMVDAFGPADFSGMTGGGGLFISAVLHKAFIKVNEEGTEAAAATAVIMSESIPPPPPVFRADHPFVFLIRENRTGSLLFLGRVANPAGKND
ncbi:MAG: serpin family protein [Chloroflexi bacterium]|nr:serpin family protein [Chloroflexota bacterium]MBP7044304.1 serpin family protein [Chloroflexota bacterium]